MTDPKIIFIKLLESHWSLNFKPKITADWYSGSAESNQITVSHVHTQLEILGFSQSLGEAPRRFRAAYNVDVWSHEQNRRYLMTQEVDRIVHSKCSNPGEGLEYSETSSWRDLDEEGHPRLFRSQIRLEVLYYG